MIPKVATEDQLKIEIMARRLEITENVGPLAASLGLNRSAGREIAAERLAQSFAQWTVRSAE